MERLDGARRESTADPVVVVEADHIDPALVRTVIDIDLQTFSEPVFTHYTAAAVLQNGRVFLLTVDGQVVGTCVLLRCWDHPRECTLLSMGILPGFRGQGLGLRFLGEVFDRLRASGLEAVTLLVGQGNKRARKVYVEAGFQPTGTRHVDPRTHEIHEELRANLFQPVLTAL
jgi:ribosomal protein S18 acetylase RimI-like enzyme